MGDVSGYDTALAARLGQGREGEMIFFFFVLSFSLSDARCVQNNKQDGGLVSVGLSVRRRVVCGDGGLRTEG